MLYVNNYNSNGMKINRCTERSAECFDSNSELCK